MTCKAQHPPRLSRAGVVNCWYLARLAVSGVLATLGAELAQLNTVGSVPTVLTRDVVAVLAFRARKSDLGTNVVLSHGKLPALL